MPDESVRFELPDENPFVGPDLENLAFRERFDRALDRFAADTEFFPELGLRRQTLADFQSALADQTDQLFFDHFGLLSLIVFRHFAKFSCKLFCVY